MSGKYDTGRYVITLFDERGAKIDQFPMGDAGLIASKEHGKHLMDQGRCASFNIHRNLYNSMDARGPW